MTDPVVTFFVGLAKVYAGGWEEGIKQVLSAESYRKLVGDDKLSKFRVYRGQRVPAVIEALGLAWELGTSVPSLKSVSTIVHDSSFIAAVPGIKGERRLKMALSILKLKSDDLPQTRRRTEIEPRRLMTEIWYAVKLICSGNYQDEQSEIDKVDGDDDAFVTTWNELVPRIDLVGEGPVKVIAGTSPVLNWEIEIAEESHKFERCRNAYSNGETFVACALARFGGQGSLSVFGEYSQYEESYRRSLLTALPVGLKPEDQWRYVWMIVLPSLRAEFVRLIGHSANCGLMATPMEFYTGMDMQSYNGIFKVSKNRTQPAYYSDWIRVIDDKIREFEDTATMRAITQGTKNVVLLVFDLLDVCIEVADQLFECIVELGMRPKWNRKRVREKDEEDERRFVKEEMRKRASQRAELAPLDSMMQRPMQQSTTSDLDVVVSEMDEDEGIRSDGSVGALVAPKNNRVVLPQDFEPLSSDEDDEGEAEYAPLYSPLVQDSGRVSSEGDDISDMVRTGPDGSQTPLSPPVTESGETATDAADGLEDMIVGLMQNALKTDLIDLSFFKEGARSEGGQLQNFVNVVREVAPDLVETAKLLASRTELGKATKGMIAAVRRRDAAMVTEEAARWFKQDPAKVREKMTLGESLLGIIDEWREYEDKEWPWSLRREVLKWAKHAKSIGEYKLALDLLRTDVDKDGAPLGGGMRDEELRQKVARHMIEWATRANENGDYKMAVDLLRTDVDDISLLQGLRLAREKLDSDPTPHASDLKMKLDALIQEERSIILRMQQELARHHITLDQNGVPDQPSDAIIRSKPFEILDDLFMRGVNEVIGSRLRYLILGRAGVKSDAVIAIDRALAAVDRRTWNDALTMLKYQFATNKSSGGLEKQLAEVLALKYPTDQYVGKLIPKLNEMSEL